MERDGMGQDGREDWGWDLDWDLMKLMAYRTG